MITIGNICDWCSSDINCAETQNSYSVIKVSNTLSLPQSTIFQHNIIIVLVITSCFLSVEIQDDPVKVSNPLRDDSLVHTI